MAISNLTATAISSSRVDLAWSTTEDYDYIEIYRDAVMIGLVGSRHSLPTSYSDTSCLDGTAYSYQLQGVYNDPPSSVASNTASATTPLPAPSGLSASSGTGGTQVDLAWVDNSANETAMNIYRDGSLLVSLGANVTAYSDTTTSPSVVYSYYITASNGVATSAPSNTEIIFTSDPPAAPSGLTAVATATTKIRLNWIDNSDNENDFHIEQSSTSGSAGFSEITTVSESITTYEVTSLVSNTQYWFRVRSHNASGYSAYCTVATAVTFAAIAAPTNLVCVPITDTIVDLYFDDNSELEDDHRVERKTGAGAYSEIATLEPNRNAYRNTGLSAGTTYTYKVRAKQGGSYSGYSDEVVVTTLATPSTPTGLAVLEYQDTWLRLGWDEATDVDGYNINQSTDGVSYTEIAVIRKIEATEFRVPNLSPNTPYYFTISTFNGAGNSAATAAVTQTTRSAYSPSAFERLVRQSKPNLVYLVEANPAIELTGWSLTTAMTYTHEMDFDERGAVIDGVTENGESLTEKTSIATVEATAGTWWHDAVNKKVYVHASGGDTPNNYTIIGSFWLYFTNWQVGSTIYNNNYYLPLVAQDGIPDISQQIQRYYEGNFTIDMGTVSFINGEINKANYFDGKFGRYLWLNRNVKVLAGGEAFTYSQFEPISTGIVTDYNCTDTRFTLSLRDHRDNLHRTLPIDHYWTTEFANLDSSADGRVKAFGYGAITNAVPTCIDTVNRIYEFHAGRIDSVAGVYQNGTTLSAGTDYFIDYQRGRVILARGMTWTANDSIKVDFTGQVFGDDENIRRGADIFRDIMTRFLGLTDDDLDLDSIWATRQAKTTALSLYIWKELDSQELIRRIEHSIQADSFQSFDGKIGIRVRETSAPSDIKYIQNETVSDFSMSRSSDDTYSKVIVYYNEDPSEDRFDSVSAVSNAALYKHNSNKTLEIYTALITSATATTLATDIINLLMKSKISFATNRVLFKSLPADLIYLTRTRYFNQAGTVSNKLLRILSISKQQSSGRTAITAEEV